MWPALEIRAGIVIQRAYRKHRGSKARRELAFKSCEDNKLSIQSVSNSTVSMVLSKASTSLLQERMHSIVTIQRCYRKWSSYKLALSVREDPFSCFTSCFKDLLQIVFDLEDPGGGPAWPEISRSQNMCLSKAGQ